MKRKLIGLSSLTLSCIALGCACWTVNALAQDRLIFAVDIIRHGDRTPTSELPGAGPSLWPEGVGQLTAQGANQEYKLGLSMRALYWPSGLLASNGQAGSVCAFSTDTDRTRASARMFLKGLLANAAPSVRIHTKIPIDLNAGLSETNSIPAAALLIPTDRSDYPTLLYEYVFPTPEWIATNAMLRPRFEQWSRLTGRQIGNAHDLIPPGDTLYIHQLHRVPAPPGLGPDEAQAIIDAGRWALVYQYRAELGRITGKPLLGKIAEYLTNSASQTLSRKNPALKYVLFSAHDSTLMSALSALRSPLTGTNSPPYAALLHFGLFETARTNFYVKIIYRDGAGHIVPSPNGGGPAWSLADLLGLTAP